MKPEPNCCRKLATYIIYISLIIFASIQLCKGLSKEAGNERILSRRRRYLIFPEGSSLQIVYDTYHPVVDYTNLLVVGITGALAWELPSKPVYPEDELQEIYKNGSLPLLRRNDDSVEINKFQDENIRGLNREIQSHIPTKLSLYNGSTKSRYYLSYPNNPFRETSAHTNIDNQLSNRKPSVKNIRNRSHSHFQTQYQKMHPKFRKRSSTHNAATADEQIFHLKLHRSSRHKLYRHLEKFIDTTGHAGRDCILKALCESGQVKENEKPRSFLGEIIIAIFSLPDLQLLRENIGDELYDVAHRENCNCTKKYPKCDQNIWKSFH